MSDMLFLRFVCSLSHARLYIDGHFLVIPMLFFCDGDSLLCAAHLALVVFFSHDPLNPQTLAPFPFVPVCAEL